MAAEERPEFVDVGATNILTLMQMRRVNDPETGFALEMELRDEVVNPFRSLHGGLMATLIECSAAGRAVTRRRFRENPPFGHEHPLSHDGESRPGAGDHQGVAPRAQGHRRAV